MDTQSFRITSGAARQILAQAASSEAAGLALRVAARQEADGTIAYGMGFDDIAADDDPTHVDGLAVVIAAGCEPLLEGTVLDFVELAPGEFNFIFIPPATAAQEAAPEADPEAAPARGCGSGGCSGCGGA